MFRSILGGVLRLTLPLLVVVAVAEPAHPQEARTRVALRSDLTTQEQDLAQQDLDLRNEKANALILEAQGMQAVRRWRNAARRYEEAGLLLSEHDTRSIDAFSASSRSYYSAGNNRDAARMAEKAGERALDLGEVYRAARAFQQAAVLRTEMGQEVGAQELGWRSCRLSFAPSLSEAERAKIRSGFENCSMELPNPVALSDKND